MYILDTRHSSIASLISYTVLCVFDPCSLRLMQCAIFMNGLLRIEETAIVSRRCSQTQLPIAGDVQMSKHPTLSLQQALTISYHTRFEVKSAQTAAHLLPTHTKRKHKQGKSDKKSKR